MFDKLYLCRYLRYKDKKYHVTKEAKVIIRDALEIYYTQPELLRRLREAYLCPLLDIEKDEWLTLVKFIYQKYITEFTEDN